MEGGSQERGSDVVVFRTCRQAAYGSQATFADVEQEALRGSGLNTTKLPLRRLPACRILYISLRRHARVDKSQNPLDVQRTLCKRHTTMSCYV